MADKIHPGGLTGPVETSPEVLVEYGLIADGQHSRVGRTGPFVVGGGAGGGFVFVGENLAEHVERVTAGDLQMFELLTRSARPSWRTVLYRASNCFSFATAATNAQSVLPRRSDGLSNPLYGGRH